MMKNADVLDKSIDCVADARSLIESLDSAPTWVRKQEQAKQARRTAVAAVELIAELVQRVHADMVKTGQVEQTGGDNGDTK